MMGHLGVILARNNISTNSTVYNCSNCRVEFWNSVCRVASGSTVELKAIETKELSPSTRQLDKHQFWIANQLNKRGVELFKALPQVLSWEHQSELKPISWPKVRSRSFAPAAHAPVNNGGQNAVPGAARIAGLHSGCIVPLGRLPLKFLNRSASGVLSAWCAATLALCVPPSAEGQGINSPNHELTRQRADSEFVPARLSDCQADPLAFGHEAGRTPPRHPTINPTSGVPQHVHHQ